MFFRFAADRIPVMLVLLIGALDFAIYFSVDSAAWLSLYALVMILPKGIVCAWNHHHQHSMTFHGSALNRFLEFVYALQTGVTTNLWVLHHVQGHHKNFLDQSRDESRWKFRNGRIMNPLEYTLSVSATAYYRGYLVGRRFPRLQRDFILFSSLTFVAVAFLCWLRLVPALFVFVLPMIVSLMFTSWVTYDHHAGLDVEDQFEGSYNNMNPLFNLLTGNLGYHTAHHYRQGLHWSKLPELHEKIKHRIPENLIRNAPFVLAES